MAFDNSTNHGSIPADGLNVSLINVNPKDKQPHMRSTHFGSNNIYQSMVFPANHSKYPNQLKGM